MNSKLSVIALLSSIFFVGCSTANFSQSQQVPLEDVIVANKHALVRAGERMVFEEFVKYKELGSTVALYTIGEVTLDASVKATTSKSGEVTAEAKFPGGGLGAKATTSVSGEQEGKLEIKLTPLGNSPAVYNSIKEKFGQANGRGGIYGIVYAANADEAKMSPCTAEDYCFTLRDTSGSRMYAYLLNVQEFRALLDQIRNIAPPAAPEKKKQSE